MTFDYYVGVIRAEGEFGDDDLRARFSQDYPSEYAWLRDATQSPWSFIWGSEKNPKPTPGMMQPPRRYWYFPVIVSFESREDAAMFCIFFDPEKLCRDGN